MNRYLFRSLDRLLALLKITDSFVLVQQALNIVILFFKNREILQKKEFEYFEPHLPELFNLVRIFMSHQNLNNKMEISLCDYFRDDPGYPRYLEANKNEVRESTVAYDNRLFFECIYPGQQTQSYDQKSSNLTFREPILLSVKYDNIYVIYLISEFLEPEPTIHHRQHFGELVPVTRDRTPQKLPFLPGTALPSENRPENAKYPFQTESGQNGYCSFTSLCHLEEDVPSEQA
jgi:hypothetical protein